MSYQYDCREAEDDFGDNKVHQPKSRPAEYSDTALLDWLEENLSYVMLGVDYKKGRTTQRILDSRGHGWRNGELRRAIVSEIIKEK